MEQSNSGDSPRRSDESTREQRRRARQQRHTSARERESRIDAAETQFYNAGTAIAAAQQDLDAVLAAAERRIGDARARTADKIGEQRRRRAQAVAAIRAEDCTVDQVADILALTPKQVRELLAEARSVDAPRTTPAQTDPPPTTDTPAQLEPGEISGPGSAVDTEIAGAEEPRRPVEADRQSSGPGSGPGQDRWSGN